ncbi:MAG: hypothetical protein WC821_05390 [archaeon]|jgi:hypothetical protein
MPARRTFGAFGKSVLNRSKLIFSLPKRKKWVKTSTIQMHKLKPGDMVLTAIQRHTLGGLTSRVVARAINGDYSHVSAYMGKAEGVPRVRDFKGRFGHRTMAWDNLAKVGVNVKVVRWKGASKEQIQTFLHNLDLIPRKIGRRYDYPQAVGYAYVLQLMKLFRLKNPEKLLPDLEKFYTCSEYLSTAGNPNPKEIKAGAKMINPPLLFDKNLSPEMITPTTIDLAAKAGILEVVTTQTWKKMR